MPATLNRVFFIIILCVSHLVSSQTLTPAKIDSISKAAQALLASGTNREYIKIQEYLNKESKKN